MVRRKQGAKVGRKKGRKAARGVTRVVKRASKVLTGARPKRKPQAVTVASARRFIAQAKIPPAPRARAAPLRFTVETAFDSIKNQAVVVGSNVVSFVQGVTTERREAIVNSSLLAQLVAQKTVPGPGNVGKWFNTYFNVLKSIGWVVQDVTVTQYGQANDNVEAHQAVLAVATSLLGATAPAALALVKTTLDALKSMNANSPWITLFSRESQRGSTAHFQVSLAEQDAADQFFVYLMALEIEAKSTITQVLFFKFKSNEATMRHHAGKVTINTSVLEKVGGEIKAKLAQHASDYIKALPDLN